MQERKEKYDLVSVVGPTACGKTSLAVKLALAVPGAEIISADSRQVYRGMDIGTGKDIAEYTCDGVTVPSHLLDIVDAGEKYNLFEFQRDFLQSYEDIRHRGGFPIMCGGSGLYVESVLKGYRLLPVPENPALRAALEEKTLEELTALLATYKQLHNNTDTDNKKRAIRAIEIEEYYRTCPVEERYFPQINALTIGVQVDREVRRERISRRLRERLDCGMVEEVRRLLDSGLEPEQLIYYGLEYKYLTLYLTGKMGYDEMVSGLEIAIHQFAKRQMTWFRGMEKRGVQIHWIDASRSVDEMVEQIKTMMYE
ncbi:MAG: tRNA (adenosine(37)-N6)-dimethylallyltransferase MiaA [Bacteroidaceae bacterium]|nr:tRNA (adenosine(37)-N6)-dimethylallyltransferase MiaA [Bacteroidaceae bacterium]